MFIDKNGTWIEKNARKVELKCDNCGNTSQNQVVGVFESPHIGFVFLPKRMELGKKGYYLCCPICDNANKKISLEELNALKK